MDESQHQIQQLGVLPTQTEVDYNQEMLRKKHLSMFGLVIFRHITEKEQRSKIMIFIQKINTPPLDLAQKWINYDQLD